jgi:hypothetical protein
MSAIARRLARLEEQHTAAALAALRQTLEAYEVAQRAYLEGRDPERTAHDEAEAAAREATLTPQQRDHVARLHEAIPILHAARSTPAEQASAIALLEPLVQPRGSPPYSIVGAVRRHFAGWLTEMEATAAGEGEANR